ncbi:MAG: hypothetical protein IKV62_06045 [Bacteroidales bacterium]|nr:hypothetical protein [Bacteroidales bacterium]
MKKLFYSVLALAGILAVSCNKEIEAPVAAPEHTGNTHTVTLKAAFAQEGETRTAYANNKTFSWVEGDVVYVRCVNEEEEKWYWAEFAAQSSGATTDLTGEVDDGYEPYDVAVYVPGPNYVGSVYYNESTVRVVAPISYHQDGYGLTEASDGNEPYWNSVAIPSDNPLSLLPLVSVTKDEVLYFQTAMGALKLNLTDVDATVDHVRIIAANDGALGNYLMVQDGEIRMSEPWCDDEGQRYATSFCEYYFKPVSDGKVSFVIPMPVGTLAAGSEIDLMDAEGNVVYRRAFQKDVVIPRNKITELASLSTQSDWESIGIGYFYDLPIFYYMGSDYLAPVEIFKDKNNPSVYRIDNPYPVAAETAEYTINDSYLPLPEYYTLTISPDNFVTYDDMHSGYGDGGLDGDVFNACPGDWGGDNTYNFVARYQEDGTPANIIISSLYLYKKGTGYYYYFNSDSYKYMWTMLLFPGIEDQLDLSADVTFDEIADDNASQAVGQVTVKLGDDVPSAYVVIAANEADAEAAVAAGKGVEVSGEESTVMVNFPAEAPTGKYIAYVKTVAPEGFTANCALGFASDPFDYFRSDEDRQLTAADIVGTYTATNYYNNGGWTANPVTMTIVVEESDDPLSGEIMFTDVCPEVLSPLGSVKKVSAVYPDFNTATGAITINAKSEIYKVKTTTYSLANFYGDNISLMFTTDGTIYLEANIAFYDGDTRKAWTNTKVTFSKASSASAPALAPAQQGPVSFEAASEQSASRPVPMLAPKGLLYMGK